ncbi:MULTISPECIES: PTS sugar transporter subunit IIA [Propionispora]|uniref:PTS system, galactitol-specific IIA component n=2 Tax=Propionispora TaxID=112902 RepID=A0A1H8R9V4_9FIRM|nr:MULTISPECIES: PTS sugar transporter subunit IIA [Propionispora]SEO63172.1 PTS system, galactitol-specific IIA component [Propionispora vibrioides]SHJ67705.1 PTS system, galactitol-specific IIA component [Propionispora hippei DSM 15287]
MPVRNTFDRELVFREDGINDKNEILRYIATRMYELQYVKETYIQAVIDREKTFPTGLQTEAFGVAIPHSDTIHVHKPVIAVCILAQPVIFQVMGSGGGEEVPVSFIFMLAIDDPNKHIEMLNKLSILFQNKNIMLDLLETKTGELYQKLNYYINH